jgi:hypothetical protein
VSCAKDEKTRDVFRAPPPVIHSKSTEELKAWDRRSDKSLDLQDSFDVSAGNPAKLEVVSRCRRGQQSYYETFSLAPRAPVKIFQVMPSGLLTAAIENVDCNFELTLFNEVGSKHIYQIASVPVTDESAPGVTLEKSGSDEKITRMNARKLDGLRARYRNSGPAAAQLVCEETSLPDQPFEQVMELAHFDFSKPVGKPLQACRVLVRQSGRIQQISSRFMMQFPQPPMAVAVQTIAPDKQERALLLTGVPLNAALITLKNPDSTGSRFLRVKKAGESSSVQIYYPGQTGNVNAMRPSYLADYGNRKWSYAVPQAGPGVEDKGDHFRVTVPAGKTAAFFLQIRPAGRMVCDRGLVNISTDLVLAGKVEFVEVADTGEALDVARAEMPRAVYMDLPPAYAANLPAPVAGPCIWN